MTPFAMVGRNDDVRIGVKSLAVLSGRNDRIVIGICQVVTLMVLCIVGVMEELNQYFYLSFIGAAFVGVWYQILCRPDNRERFFSAFLDNSWLEAMVFEGTVHSYL